MLDVLLALLGLFFLFLALTWVFPSLLRAVFWVFVRVLYRFTTYHRERIPKTGGGLIVCNHVSYVDWLVLWVACPRRVTFVLWNTYYRNPILRFFLSWGRRNTIRIDDRTNRPHSLMKGMKEVAAALDAGRLVVIFPEGRLTRSGAMLPFARGIEMVMRLTTTDVPIIPACTDGLWGGFFSHFSGPIMRKFPKAFRPRVSTWFGKPVFAPTHTALIPQPPLWSALTPQPPLPGGEGEPDFRLLSPGERGLGGEGQRSEGEGQTQARRAISSRRFIPAADLRLLVQEAIADHHVHESNHVPMVHRAFLANATRLRSLFRPCVLDHSTGTTRTLSWSKTLVAALLVTRYLRPRLSEVRNVGTWLPTSLGGALANLALAFLGRTSVNLNYTAGVGAVRSAIRQADLRIVITAKRFLSRMPFEPPDGVQLIYLEDVLDSVTKWQRIRTFLMVLLLPTWVIDRFVLGLHQHKVDDPLTIVFSSGSTGEPKGVVLTHRNVGANVDSTIRTIDIGPTDRLFGALPLFHSFGYTVCLWAPLVARCSVLFFPDPRQAKEVGELARTHRPTILLSTATFLRFYLRRCDRDDFRSVRLLICGAEKLPVKLQGEFRDKFGVLPLEGYGCTELSPVISTNVHDVVLSGLVQQRNQRGSAGQPILGVCVKAFAIEESGQWIPLPAGVEGVLCVKGANVMRGYLNQPERTAEVVRDGWYNTGDMGLIEPAGFIRITGRMSRFAKIAGEMVPLERLDDELHEILGSGGERLLAIAAIPDEKRGERLIVLHLPDVEAQLSELLDALGKRGLPNLWVPDRRDCHKVDLMPVLGSGKLDLRKLSDLARELGCR